MTETLPIDAVIPDIRSVLAAHQRLVLSAPPGAGKTTRVPLELLKAPWREDGRILLLEPRRIAARLAARHMAAMLGEKVGDTVGLSTRVERRVSARTRIEVMTDGLFVRRLLGDPELGGVAAVLFDEFHERALTLDLGLALARECQSALRPDLRLVMMSATLDSGDLAGALDAEAIVSAGRAFPVDTRYLGRTDAPIEDRMADAVRGALRAETGSILAFLPGQKEIRRTSERLGALGDDVLVAPLYGALSPGDQDAAIAPAPPGCRKIVLATDIAESSLTIEGVRIVIDSGLARLPVFHPATGTSRLETRRASLANVDQRRGRAGRTEPGVCYRLWAEPSERGLPPYPVPEIQDADLSGMLLALAEWGEPDPTKLPFLDAPPVGRVEAARAKLVSLGALDKRGHLTEAGRAMARLPLPPDLAALVVRAETDPDRRLAAELAAVLSERGIGGGSADLRDRLARFRRDSSPRATALKRQAARWSGTDTSSAPIAETGRILAAALPGRIARSRGPTRGDYTLAGGGAAHLDPEDALASAEWLVVADLAGSAKRARILAAAPIDEDEAKLFGAYATGEDATFDPETGSVRARRVERIGTITLKSVPLPRPGTGTVVRALLGALSAHGLSMLPAADAIRTLQARLEIAASASGEPFPDLSDEALIASAEDWLVPALGSPPSLDRAGASVTMRNILAMLPWPQQQALDKLAPLAVTLPSGRAAPVDYMADGAPAIEGRVQEFFGSTRHPSIAHGRVPLSVRLLSPARRPVAVTGDVPGFWKGGYADMAKDMRGRYPKHDWPADPATARPHEGRTKARL